MSSFTYQYQQPDEYHFSLDSIHLAEFVAKRLQSCKDLESLRVLDLCAGCGVVGIELSWYVRELRKFDFIEVQDIYTTYFHKNTALVNRSELQLKWNLVNYDVLHEDSWKNKFDLIVSNPPYFPADLGMLSPSDFKNRCRFFLDSSFANYITGLANTLALGGEAYFLLRPLEHHGYHLIADAQELLSSTRITIKKIGEIRASDVILMKAID